MTIQEVEKLTGISRPNIRFYEKENLLFPERNSQNGYRVYEKEHVVILEKIKILRRLGISIDDIKAMMEGRQSLLQAVLLREQEIAKEQEQLVQIREICQELAEKNCSFETLDVSLLLLKWNLKEFKEEKVMKEKEKWNRMEQIGKLMSQAGAICTLAMLPLRILLRERIAEELLTAVNIIGIVSIAVAFSGLALFGIASLKGRT